MIRQEAGDVRWTERGLFCAWNGKRLPYSYELQYASRGNTSFVFPWGNEATQGRDYPQTQHGTARRARACLTSVTWSAMCGISQTSSATSTPAMPCCVALATTTSRSRSRRANFSFLSRPSCTSRAGTSSWTTPGSAAAPSDFAVWRMRLRPRTGSVDCVHFGVNGSDAELGAVRKAQHYKCTAPQWDCFLSRREIIRRVLAKVDGGRGLT